MTKTKKRTGAILLVALSMLMALPVFNTSQVAVTENAAMTYATYAEDGEFVDEAAFPALAYAAWALAPAAAAVSTAGSFGSAVSDAWSGRVWTVGSDYGMHTDARSELSGDIIFDR